jgi:hypothetical protein
MQHRLIMALVLTLAAQPTALSLLRAEVQFPAGMNVQEVLGLRVTAAREIPHSRNIELVFDDASAATLRYFSSRVAGSDVAFFVNGRKLATLKLRVPIVGGSVMLSGDFSSEFRAQLMGATRITVDLRVQRPAG